MRDMRSINGHQQQSFSLIELMVVIAIIAVLAGLLFPAAQSVLERAKKIQARNDLIQIVTAVTAFYGEYGTYPTSANGTDSTYGPGYTSSKALFDELRAKTATLNTRQIVFISPPEDGGQANPKGKIGSDGQLNDPWGTPYWIRMDSDYDNQVGNPYATSGAGPEPLRHGIISWSAGKDGKLGTNGDNLFKDATGTQCDDVVSWQ